MQGSTKAKSALGFLLLLLLSAIFIFSALSKLMSIEPFEWAFMDMGLPNTLSYLLARFFVGFELLVAFLLLGHIYLKRFTYPLTLLFLALMTIYLVILLITKGNDVDCGCFGDALPMSPALSILKNIVLLAITFVLTKIYSIKPYRYQAILAFTGAIILLALPFLIIPQSQKPGPINLDALYQNPLGAPKIELRKGKHLLAFLSLGCPHCRSAAKIFRDIIKEDPSIPIYMVLYGHPEDTANFFADTKAQQVPHLVFENSKQFNKMTGVTFVPVIFWINNSIKERHVSYVQLNTALLANWKN